jgi:hypothetical protein
MALCNKLCIFQLHIYKFYQNKILVTTLLGHNSMYLSQTENSEHNIMLYNTEQLSFTPGIS